MSYQPFPPAAQAPPASAPRRGGALIGVGVAVIVIGLLAAIAFYFAGQKRYESKIESLAQDSGALSGCITDLTFTKSGTFVFYYIAQGDVHVNGSNDGCADSDIVSVDGDDDVPDIAVELRDEDGERIRLGSTSLDEDTALTAGGVRAFPYRAANINSEGDYEIEVTAPEGTPRFAIGVGPAIEEPTLVIPLIAAIAGVLIGVLLIIVGTTRRNRIEPVAVTYGYPPYQQQPAQFPSQPPVQYPNQPPVTYNPPAAEGFDHPTQAMPPIVTSPEPVGPFEQGGWSVPGQPLPPPPGPPVKPDDSQDR